MFYIIYGISDPYFQNHVSNVKHRQDTKPVFEVPEIPKDLTAQAEVAATELGDAKTVDLLEANLNIYDLSNCVSL